MVTNRCAWVEIHDFLVPTIEMYLLVEISLENTGFVYLQYFFWYFAGFLQCVQVEFHKFHHLCVKIAS